MDSDLALLHRYHRQGDAEAFQRLVETHAGMVHAVACRVTGDSSLAKDVAQETFLALARSGEAAVQSVAAWLHAVASLKARHAVRGETRRRSREAIAADQLHPEQTEASWHEIEPILDEAIAQLSERTRSLIVMRYLEGRTQQEVAERHGISQSSVSRALESGIGELRAALRSGGIFCGAALASLISTNSSHAAPVALTASLGKIAISGTGAKPLWPLTLTSLLAMTTNKVLIITAIISMSALGVWKLKNGMDYSSQPPRMTQASVAKEPASLDDPKPATTRSAATSSNRQSPSSLSLEEIWSEAMSLPDDKALIMEAFQKLGGTIKEGVVEQQIETMIRKGFSNDRAAFEASLSRNRLTLDQFKEQQHEKIVIAVMQARITRGITDPAAKKRAIEDWLSGLRKDSAAHAGRKQEPDLND